MKFLLLIILFISFCLNAAEKFNEDKQKVDKAQVIVLNAPVFERPSLESKVAFYLRKGDMIYIHPSETKIDRPIPNYQFEFQMEGVNRQPRDKDGFYTTLDKFGREVYIPRKFVKVLFRDSRELEPKDMEYDMTDYRLQEPLPTGYPLYNQSGYRGHVAIGTAAGPKNHYTYDKEIFKEEYGSTFEIMGTATTKVGFNKEERFYFGGILLAGYQKSSFSLSSNLKSKEEHMRLGLGPYLSYDVFRYDRHTFSFNGGLVVFLLNRTSVTVNDESDVTDILAEKRSFANITISPRLETLYQYKNFLSDLNFVAGASMQFFYAHDLNPTSKAEVARFWNNQGEDFIAHPFGAEFSLFFGVQASYE